MATVLSQLRDLCPPRRLAPYEARRVAEQQAGRLLTLMRVEETPVPEQIIEYLPRMRVEYIHARALSGGAQWRRGRWVIVVNRTETWGRQRFSLAHEFKHVIDGSLADTLYRSGDPATRTALAERAADTFAACLLMPRPFMKRVRQARILLHDAASAWDCADNSLAANGIAPSSTDSSSARRASSAPNYPISTETSSPTS